MAFNPGVAQKFWAEYCKKQEQGFCKIIKWNNIKNDIPEKFNIFPIAAIPHKLRMWRAIMDLSFKLKLKSHRLPSVINVSKPSGPPEALDFMGKALPRLIA